MSVSEAQAKQGSQYQVAPRVAGNVTDPPGDYVELDYVPLESDLRQAVHGPWGEWAECLHRHETGAGGVTADHIQMASDAKLFNDTCVTYEVLEKGDGLDFLTRCSAHLSSFIKARVSQDIMRGIANTHESVKNGLLVAVELGPLPCILRPRY